MREGRQEGCKKGERVVGKKKKLYKRDMGGKEEDEEMEIKLKDKDKKGKEKETLAMKTKKGNGVKREDKKDEK